MSQNDALEQFLTDCESRYDPRICMVGSEIHSPGYHTTLPDGMWAHQTREALDYALALLQTPDVQRHARAADVIAKVIELQDTDPTSATYGIWSWFYEEPLPKMAPPDWNWADFCGARLAEALSGYEALLPDDLQGRVRESLGHAAWSIFRRNVGPGYTNIAIMGCAVTLAAGAILSETRLVNYGRARLRRLREHVEANGGFAEYNSPTYSVVAIVELERILRLSHDTAALEDADKLHRQAWQAVADHFHPGTGQWAGPHSRAYGDWLRPNTIAFLNARTGVKLIPRNMAPGLLTPSYEEREPIPCPEELLLRFQALPESEIEVRSRFIRRDPDDLSTIGTTWLTEDVCLGTINRDILWTQRRALLGYWRTDHDPAVCLRLRFLHDGRDFSSGFVVSAQSHNRVLSLCGLIVNGGDFHPSLDVPKDGTFRASELRLRYELSGAGVEARQVGERAYELSAGGRRAVIHTGDSWFDGEPVRWEIGRTHEQVYLDAVCWDGEEKTIRPAEFGRTAICATVEILEGDASASPDGPAVSIREDGRAHASWPLIGGLEVALAAKPEKLG